MLLLMVLNRLVRLVPRELETHALISCLREVSYDSELSVLRSRRVVFLSRLARPCLEKHNILAQSTTFLCEDVR